MPEEIKELEAQSIEYSPSFAFKKVLWSLASWKAAVPAGIAMAPTATSLIEKVSAITCQFGIILHIDKPVFEGMLPVIIFAGIIGVHDFAKVKFQDKDLANKIL